MALRMASLSRTRSGLWTARKVIPQDVRAAYGKREEKPTWPATLNQSQARAEFGAWLAAVEDRIASLRSQEQAEPITLSQRQSRALAGRWYQEMVESFSDNPGNEIDWDVARESLYPEETEESYRASLSGDQRPYEGPWRIPLFLPDDAKRLLERERLVITEASREQLHQDMASLYLSLCELMIRRTGGDYGSDPVAPTLPEWRPVVATPAQQPASESARIMAIFDGYVAERRPAASTVKAFRAIMEKLVAFLGHDDSGRVTPDDMVRWKDHLLAKGLAAKSVREKYLAAAKAIFSWAKDNRRMASNPALEVKVRAPKAQTLRSKGFTDDEARTILKATLLPVTSKLSEGNKLARRWIPWICAYTGARVNEITQLRHQDVFEQDGIWVLRITPEAGSVKTHEARSVPIHSHLIDQGFLKIIVQGSQGPIFYDPSKHRGGSEGNPQSKKVSERLAQWVRSLGVDDPHVAPNHGWRHRFKTEARSARMDPEAREVIPGHAPASEGQAYGSWTVRDLAMEIEKFPRIELV